MKNFCLNPWAGASLAAVTLLLNSCAPGQDVPTPTASINVSHYLAVGDSYTAGYSADGLTRTGQEYSFPNLLARQLRGATPEATFTQPLLEAGTGTGFLDLVNFTTAGLPRARRVAGQAVRGTIIDPNACGGPDTVRLFARNASAGTLPQNMGVPGLLLTQVETAGLGNEAQATPGTAFNPYFERLLPAADSRTYLQAVTDAAASATFFTYFQGIDDLMPYVRSGGQSGPLPTSTFTTQLTLNANKVLDRLTAGGRPGIIAKLPALATLPLLRLGKAYDLQARLRASFGDTASVYVEGPFGSSVSQPISDGDYVLATALPKVGQLTPVLVGGATQMLPYGRNIRNPLRDAEVLDKDELGRISGVLNNYNTNLETLAASYKLPIITGTQRTLDLDVALFDQVAGIISVGGVQYSSEPVRGNFYSLDY